MKKKLLSLTLAFAMCLTLTIPALAVAEAPLSAEEGTQNIGISADLGGLSLEDVKIERPWTIRYREDEEADWMVEDRSTYGAVRPDAQFTVRHTGGADDGTTLSIYATCYRNTSDEGTAYTWLDWPHTACLTQSGVFVSDDQDLEQYGGLVALRAGESVTFTLPFDWYGRKGQDVTVELRAVMDFPQFDWTYWKVADFRVDESSYVAASIKGPSVKDPEPVAFDDVKSTDWFCSYVEKAVAAGLMSGTSDNLFSPTQEVSISEVLVLAYQIHSQSSGGSLPSPEGAWYMPYYQYCLDYGVITPGQMEPSNLARKANRFDVVSILDKAAPAECMTPVKESVVIPDLAETDSLGDVVYKWYRAGIMSGDQKGCFNGSNSISRAEVAVILCQLNRL